MKVIIIGSGAGGLTTALAMQQAGIEATVYEQAPEPRAAGAGLTLWANAVRVLRDLGVQDGISTDGIEVAGAIRRWDGLALSQMDAREIQRRYGAPSVAMHRIDLMHALLKQLENPVQYGKRLLRYEQTPDAICAVFDDGTSAEADVLVGADGIHSIVRGQMHPDSKPVYRGYPAWRAVLEFDHAQVGDRWGETWGRGARFGIVPLSRERIYWFATENRPANTPPANHKARLREVFGKWHDPIPALIQATPDDALLYNDIADLETLPNWVDGRAVLLGDAAHATTPNMGQGACQAIEDGQVLAQKLQRHPSIAAALDAFQQERLPHTHKVVTQSRTIGRVGQLENPLLVALRNTAVRAMPAQISLNQFDFALRER